MQRSLFFLFGQFCFWVVCFSVFSIPALAEDYSVVALGNSLTVHGPSEALGWSGNWGMAATAEGNDYVSVLQQRLRAEMNISGRVLVKRFSLYKMEKNGEIEDSILRSNLPGASLVVIELGDNVEKTEGARQKFKENYQRLLERVRNEAGSVAIVCLGTWWGDAQVDVVVRSACTDMGKFVAIYDLSSDPLNLAANERPGLVPGVGAHPGDRGMRMIAERIVLALRKD